MLNKKLCIKCWKNIPYNGWMKSDEKRWNEGEVICPFKYREKRESTYRDITDNPPSKCPFMLEYILSEKD